MSDDARQVVMGVPVYGRLDLTERAVRSLDAETPIEIELILLDDCGPQRLTEELVASWLGTERPRRLVLHETNRGFVGGVNHLFELAGAADVIVINSDVEVLPGWFAALVESVVGRPRVASASSLADEGSLLSVPALRPVTITAPLLAELRADSPVSAEIPVAVAHCTWFTRAAIEAVGGFDRAFDPGYGEEVDWSLRAARQRFVHLAALHSYVRHVGGATFGADHGWWSLQRRHELRLLSRYPRRWLGIRRFARDPDTPFAQARDRIGQALAAAGQSGSGAPPTGHSSG